MTMTKEEILEAYPFPNFPKRENGKEISREAHKHWWDSVKALVDIHHELMSPEDKLANKRSFYSTLEDIDSMADMCVCGCIRATHKEKWQKSRMWCKDPRCPCIRFRKIET